MIPHDLTQPPPTDPTAIYRLRDGLYGADLLAAALVHLGLFDHLERQPCTLQTLCASLDIRLRPADVMMTLFKAMGLVEERGGVLGLTPLGRDHLLSSSPWFIGPYYASMKDRPVTLDYVTVLRTGRPANWASLKDEKAWAQAMEGDAFARQFTAAMDSRGVFLGQAVARAVDLSTRRRVLDVAGGSGIYACCLAAANPGLEAVVLEKPPVDAIAARAIAARGMSGRVGVVAGEMFDQPWPADADVHLLSNVLHDWDVPDVRRLLARSFESLQPGGMLVLHDMHLNADKTGPLPAALYSALLMSITEGRCYSVGEMGEWLSEAGFGAPVWTPTAADRSVLVTLKPAG